MLQRLRQISISSSLRGAFLTGALLTLIVSSVSLYSWHEQSSQIRYSLDEYFPRIHAAFLIEGNLNLVEMCIRDRNGCTLAGADGRANIASVMLIYDAGWKCTRRTNFISRLSG